MPGRPPHDARAGALGPARPGYGDVGEEVPEREEGAALAALLPSGGAVARCGGARAASLSRKVHGHQAERPRHWLDVKGGMVIAQSTSDIVDPYRVATGGSYVNYRGGDPRKKDLGVELDAGIEARYPLQHGLKGQVGAQGGLLFPGGAFEDAGGSRMNTQWLVVGRLGLLF